MKTLNVDVQPPQENPIDAVADMLKGLSGDTRLKFVISMDNGAMALAVVPETERNRLAQADARLATANVVMITEKQARDFGVM